MRLNKLFALEVLKINNPLNWGFIAIIFLASCIYSIIVINLMSDRKHIDLIIQSSDALRFFLENVSGSLTLLSSFFYMIHISRDYKYGLMRKNFIDGLSRNEIFNCRLLVLFGWYFICSVVIILAFICIYIFQLPRPAEFVKSIQYLEAFKLFILMIFYGTLSQLLVTLSRSSGISIIVLIVLSFADSLISLRVKAEGSSTLASYLPISLAQKVQFDTVTMSTVLVFATYCIAFLALSHFAICKRDL